MKQVLIGILLLAAGLGVGRAGVYFYDLVANPPRQSIIEGNYSREISGRPVLFVTSTCPYCKQAVSYLDGLGVDYDKQVVDQSTAAMARYRRFGQKTVPILVTRDVLVVGYKPDYYDKYLKK